MKQVLSTHTYLLALLLPLYTLLYIPTVGATTHTRSSSWIEFDTPLTTEQKRKPELATQHSSNLHLFSSKITYWKDTDGDTYQQGFTLHLDIDTHQASHYVAVQLFIRPNNGPFEHYYTTSGFYLYGDTINDSIKIKTQLVDNYPSDRYSFMLIINDLERDIYYEIPSNQLPSATLESSEHDTPLLGETYVEQKISHDGDAYPSAINITTHPITDNTAPHSIDLRYRKTGTTHWLHHSHHDISPFYPSGQALNIRFISPTQLDRDHYDIEVVLNTTNKTPSKASYILDSVLLENGTDDSHHDGKPQSSTSASIHTGSVNIIFLSVLISFLFLQRRIL